MFSFLRIILFLFLDKREGVQMEENERTEKRKEREREGKRKGRKGKRKGRKEKGKG